MGGLTLYPQRMLVSQTATQYWWMVAHKGPSEETSSPHMCKIHRMASPPIGQFQQGKAACHRLDWVAVQEPIPLYSSNHPASMSLQSNNFGQAVYQGTRQPSPHGEEHERSQHGQNQIIIRADLGVVNNGVLSEMHHLTL